MKEGVGVAAAASARVLEVDESDRPSSIEAAVAAAAKSCPTV